MPRIFLFPIILIFILAAAKGDFSTSPGPDSQGPIFLQEPKSKIDFLNNEGHVLTCNAKGSPDPIVVWYTTGGNKVTNIPNIREVNENGSLIFAPFRAESYRHDVHDTVYRCEVSNSVGKIFSREVSVKAIVEQPFTIIISDASSLKGNMICLRCDPPAFIKNFLKITSWVQNGSYNIYPLPHSDGKLHMLPTGELIIYSVDSTDSLSTFRCRAVHRLTGVTYESTNGRIIITEGKGMVAPKPAERQLLPPVRQGETAVMTCLFQSVPAPTYNWLRGENRNSLRGLTSVDRISVREGVVVIQNVQVEDAGLYVCHANNSLGFEELEQTLVVHSPITVHQTPQQATIDLGRDAEFFCSVTGHPQPTIQWFKDTIPLRNSTPRVSIYGKGDSRLHISKVTREDRGMYQCFAKNDFDSTQASSELRLGDAAPQIIYKFIKQTIKPGPAVSLKCVATGNPTPKIVWAMDGFPLPNNDRLMIGQVVTVHGDVISHVNISSTRVEDGGEYKCTASNRAGQVHHPARLNIYGLPMVRPMPGISAVAGKDLVVQCPVSGYPINAISWKKGDQVLPTNRRQEVSENGTLVIQKVDSVVDQGKYSCTAWNKQGHHDSKNVAINVQVPPKIEHFSFASDIQEGARVLVTCVVRSGDFPLRLEWLYNQRSTLPEGTTTYNYGEDVLSLSIAKASTQHTGNYTCVASNEADSVRHHAPLVVLVPPRIAPFYFNKDLSEGVRAQVSCVIEKGAPPFTINWFKDRRSLPTEGLKVIGWDGHSSTVIVEQLTSHHAGNYTCQVTNDVASDEHTARLVVSVQPRWVEQPKDQHAALGATNFQVNCQADGNPSPSVTWRRQNGPQNSYEEIFTHFPGVKVDTNGTLIFEELRKEHQGFYLCEAGNGVGSLLSQRILLTINGPAHFVVRFKNQTSRLGSNAILRCDVDGDSPLKVVWKKNGITLDQRHADYRFSLKEVNRTNGVISELQILNTAREDGGRYYCLASNSFGRDEMIIQLFLQEPPDFPRNIHVIEKGSRLVKLGWLLSQDGHSAITKSVIEYKQESMSWGAKSGAFSVAAPQVLASVQKLKPATLYHFRLFAENELGSSQPSDVLEVTTEGEAPSGPPRNVKVTPTSSTALHLHWDAPDPELSNGDILGYHVGYKETASEQFSYKAVETRSDGSNDMVLADLKKFTRYVVQVQAYNALGSGPSAPEVAGTTLEDAPGAPPQDVRCSSPNSQSLLVTWNPVPEIHLHGSLKGYKVQWENLDSDDYKSIVETKIVTTLTSIIQNLQIFTNYSVQVLAFNNAGEGIPSLPLYCITQEDLPEAPNAVRVVPASSSSIVISWLPPKKINGILIGYLVTAKFVDGPVAAEIKTKRVTVKPEKMYYQENDLHRRGSYEFSVAAMTKVGEGPVAEPITISPSSEAHATIYSFGSVFVLPWKVDARLPCYAVGRPELIFSWKLWNQPLKTSAKYKIQNDGNLLIRGLVRDDSGNYTCHVENKHGSDNIVHKLTVQVPPAAPLLHVTATTGSTIQLQWKKADNGGSRIRGFLLHYQKGDDVWQHLELDWHHSSHVLRDLQCGTKYQFLMEAFNDIGYGAKSDLVTAATDGAKPTPVAQESFVQTNITFAILLLENWVDNNCAIDHFEIAYRQRIGEEWLPVSNNIENQKQFVLRPLSPSTDYTLKVKAYNHAGSTENLYQFSTLSTSGLATETVPHHGSADDSIYYDPKMIVPVIISGIVLLSGICVLYFFVIKSGSVAEEPADRLEPQATETLETDKDIRNGSESCYSTLRRQRRLPVRPDSPGDEITGDAACTAGAEPESHRAFRGLPIPMQTFHYTDSLRKPESIPMRETKKCFREEFYKSEHEEYECESMESESGPENSASMNCSQWSCTEGCDQMNRSGISRLSRQPRLHNRAYYGNVSSPNSDTSPVYEHRSLPRRGRSKMLQLACSPLEEQWIEPIPANDFGRNVIRRETVGAAWSALSGTATLSLPKSKQPQKPRKPASALPLGPWRTFQFEAAPVLLPPSGFADGDLRDDPAEETSDQDYSSRGDGPSEFTIAV